MLGASPLLGQALIADTENAAGLFLGQALHHAWDRHARRHFLLKFLIEVICYLSVQMQKDVGISERDCVRSYVWFRTVTVARDSEPKQLRDETRQWRELVHCLRNELRDVRHDGVPRMRELADGCRNELRDVAREVRRDEAQGMRELRVDARARKSH